MTQTNFFPYFNHKNTLIKKNEIKGEYQNINDADPVKISLEFGPLYFKRNAQSKWVILDYF